MSRLVLASFGGGTRSVYVGSVLYSLAKQYQVTDIDLAFFASSSYISAGYFFAGQYETMKESWLTETPTPKLFNILNYFKNRPIIDLDYLIDYILRQAKPILAERLKDIPAEIFCSLTNLRTGQVQLHSNKDPEFDYWKLLRATITLPGYTSPGGSMYLGDECMDGVIVDFREVLARLQPGDKLVVIKSQPHQLQTLPLIRVFRIFYKENYITLPRHLTIGNFYKDLLEESRQAYEEIKKNYPVLEIAPATKIISAWDTRLSRFRRIWSFAEKQLASAEWQKKITDFLNHD
ncbi:MAG: hypothetical protein NTV81_03475 [Candidatus Komeilibacteria bacterium]|nr:hypothetical protein [Candidatus Komeilibacteria bacterium]